MLMINLMLGITSLMDGHRAGITHRAPDRAARGPQRVLPQVCILSRPSRGPSAFGYYVLYYFLNLYWPAARLFIVPRGAGVRLAHLRRVDSL